MVGIPGASAAVPSFPDNLVVFPERDFITVEGYQQHVGKTALIEVNRPGVGVVGSAESVVAAGDPAFEINHPGGVCWGAGTGLNVTPDIQTGDVVTIKFGGENAGDTRVQDARVNATPTQNGTTVVVTGHIGDGVNPEQVEQRIVEPAFKDTGVGRRDVRAVPGPLTPDEGYSSSLEINEADNTFKATYVFDEQAAADIAANAGSGVRMMSWEVQDADANRQGLTIREYGEVGGPGMGGCPAGPHDSGPVGPTGAVATKVGNDLKLAWTPAKAIPGTPAIEGYRVHAVEAPSANGERVEVGKRIDNPAATGTTISGLDFSKQYTVQIVSVSDSGETFPAVNVPLEAADTTKPTVSANTTETTFKTPTEITLTASEPGADIYYTTDGTPVFSSADVMTENVIHYTGPITIDKSMTLTFAAIDLAGNRSAQTVVEYIVTNDPVPAAPTFTGTPEVATGSVKLAWNAPDAGGAGLTVDEYSVQAFKDGVATGSPVTSTTTSATVTGLQGDTSYQFTVKARNVNGYGAESAKTDPIFVPGDIVAKAGPDQTVNRATTATTVTLDGTGSTTANATYKWEQVLKNTTDPDKVTLNGADTLKPTFSLPLYKYPMTNDPLTFRLTVTVGDVVRTDEVKVTPVPDRITVVRAQWKARDFRIEGTSTTVGGTVTIHAGGPTGPVIGTATVTAAAAPETGGVWNVRLRNNAAGNNPGTIWVESTVGGTVGPFTVTNG
ncbi:fibronectin type III domain-containing protein [Herbiconiux sp. SYSU D00978]|uniref:fibronectin type III domain-containing protein n=1 Tax=Herbiconiux sp. SYSU D00978 TaxID=2812562 RepID=UPI001A9644B5|nr:fibronectin type III domain-containing protein [Herbiconiux sp. SYSU D00978]